jgi:pyruvate/2-oxoglutarate dehydrogenase complex dihydrolipoamide acyltransferase (E2) component
MFYILTLKETLQHGQTLRVVEWHRREGELCKLGTLLVELESFKAIVEIRVSQEAVLRRILVETGESEAPGRPIAILSDSAEEVLPVSFSALQEMAVEYLFM